ncbi:MAG: hypothetical protein UHW60_01105 [Methanobrevibacter sp.]|nr:hypothetical protein [Methanobrevibacter sp.]MEE3490468.1 hypothetical protein [Methanobrevibacter sp.]
MSVQCCNDNKSSTDNTAMNGTTTIRTIPLRCPQKTMMATR